MNRKTLTLLIVTLFAGLFQSCHINPRLHSQLVLGVLGRDICPPIMRHFEPVQNLPDQGFDRAT